MRAFLILALASLLLPAQSELEAGRKLYDSQCALCHGIGGAGARGPALNRRQLKRAPDAAALESLIANGIPNTEMPAAWQISPREVTLIARYVRSLGATVTGIVPGNAARGRELFEKQRCAACHIVQGEGESWGPELTSIGDKRSAAYLRESLDNPATSFPEGFRWIEAPPVSGIRLSEDTFTVQIVDTSRRLITIEKSKAAWKAVSGKTPMPSYTRLGEDALTDLVAYLASLKGGTP